MMAEPQISPLLGSTTATNVVKSAKTHSGLGTVSYIAIFVPFVAILFASVTQNDRDYTLVSLFGALGFSLAALLFWLRANYLAANYLEERRLRRENYVKSLRHPQAATHPPDDGPTPRRRGVPRTIARLDPVFPAFLCVCAIFGAGACIIAATLQVVWDVRNAVSNGPAPRVLSRP